MGPSPRPKARRSRQACRWALRTRHQHATGAGRRGTQGRGGALCPAPGRRIGLDGGYGACRAAPTTRRAALRARRGRSGSLRPTQLCAGAAATWCRCSRRGRRRVAHDERSSARAMAAMAAAGMAASRGAPSGKAAWPWLSWPAGASCSKCPRRQRRESSSGCCRARMRRLARAACSLATNLRGWAGG